MQGILGQEVGSILVWSLQAAYVCSLFVNLILPLLEILRQLVLPSLLEITHQETSNDNAWELVFPKSTPTMECHSQMAPELCKALHTIRCLKSTVSNCHIVWVLIYEHIDF